MNRSSLLFIVLILSGLFLFSSCELAHKRHISKIRKLERRMQNIPMHDTLVSDELVEAYQEYARKYPDDSHAVDYKFRGATIALNNGKPQYSLKIFKEIITDFPNSERVALCYFMLGYVTDNYLRDFGKANQLYNEFLARYPDNDLTDDAEMALRYLGKTPDDIMNSIHGLTEDDSLRLGYKSY